MIESGGEWIDHDCAHGCDPPGDCRVVRGLALDRTEMDGTSYWIVLRILDPVSEGILIAALRDRSVDGLHLQYDCGGCDLVARSVDA